MAMQKIEFEFPDEDDNTINIEPSSMRELGAAPDVEVEDDDAEIEVIDDTPPEDRGRKKSEPPEEVTDEELEQYSANVQKRIKHYTKAYHDERREKEQAFRERQELENYAKKLAEENQRLKGSFGKSQQALIDQAKRTLESQKISLKEKLTAAYEAGESKLVVDLQDELNGVNVKLDRLANFKLPPLQKEGDEVKGQEENYRQPEVQREAVRETPAVDPKAQAWAKQNTWFGQDDEMTAFALGYHAKLARSGVDTQSDEYYEKLNSRMRQVFPDQFDDGDEVDEVQPKQQKRSAVAPVTRSSPQKKIRLTKTQVSIANRLGVPLEVYAKQVAEEMRKQ